MSPWRDQYCSGSKLSSNPIVPSVPRNLVAVLYFFNNNNSRNVQSLRFWNIVSSRYNDWKGLAHLYPSL